jgi:hypothetical protein
MRRILPVALILMAVSVNEADAIEGARIISFGTSTCGDFVAQSAQGRQMYLSWAAGYVSGANMLDQSDARLTGASWSPASFLLWLKNYCSVHDLDPFVKAVGELRRSFAVKEGLISR